MTTVMHTRLGAEKAKGQKGVEATSEKRKAQRRAAGRTGVSTAHTCGGAEGGEGNSRADTCVRQRGRGACPAGCGNTARPRVPGTVFQGQARRSFFRQTPSSTVTTDHRYRKFRRRRFGRGESSHTGVRAAVTVGAYTHGPPDPQPRGPGTTGGVQGSGAWPSSVRSPCRVGEGKDSD